MLGDWYSNELEMSANDIPMKDTGKGKGNGGDGNKGGTSWNKGNYLPFEEARASVRAIKLGKWEEWKAWRMAGRPSNIPSHPEVTYRDDGWISLPDWLGYERKKTGAIKGTYLPFEKARASVRAIKLGSKKEWHAWSKAGGRSSNIPSSPHKVYRDDGWISWLDWLGYGSEGGKRLRIIIIIIIIVVQQQLKCDPKEDEEEDGGRTAAPAAPLQHHRGSVAETGKNGAWL